MEALLEREEEQVENWNDDRLDELSRRMDAGFEKAATKEELAAARDEINRHFGLVYKNFEGVEKQFARLNDRIDRFGYAIILFAFTLSAAVIANATFG
jgi:hypothetical protein